MNAVKKISLLFLAAALIAGQCACSWRGRVIREDLPDGETATDAAPQIISPSDGTAGQSYESTVSLYFPYSEDSLLGREERTILYSANDRLENAVLNALLSGPSEDYPQLNPIVNEKTQIVNTSLSGNCLFITFNSAFLDPVSEMPENWTDDAELLATVRAQRRLAVLSIVNSVTAVPGVRQVQILVDTGDDGLGRRIRRQDVGLSPTGDNVDELLEAISRQYASNASLQTVSSLVFRLMQDKNADRLYTYIADGYNDEKPTYAQWIDAFRSVEWTLESYEVMESVPGYDGESANVFVNAKFNISLGGAQEYMGVKIRFVCQSGVWKVEYDSLRAILPSAQ